MWRLQIPAVELRQKLLLIIWKKTKVKSQKHRYGTFGQNIEQHGSCKGARGGEIYLHFLGTGCRIILKFVEFTLHIQYKYYAGYEYAFFLALKKIVANLKILLLTFEVY
jgi:hypothetical protein